MSIIENNLNEYNRKPTKMWVDEGSEFYNRSMKSWLQGYDRNVFSAY